jgi:hypothetical protein
LIEVIIQWFTLIGWIDRRPLDIIPELTTGLPGHVDIPRMRKGHLGGAFFTVVSVTLFYLAALASLLQEKTLGSLCGYGILT